jgi:hypothetical protein
LSGGCKEQVWGRRDGQRRAVMFGHVVAPDAGFVRQLEHAQALLVGLVQVEPGVVVDPVENAELEVAVSAIHWSASRNAERLGVQSIPRSGFYTSQTVKGLRN